MGLLLQRYRELWSLIGINAVYDLFTNLVRAGPSEIETHHPKIRLTVDGQSMSEFQLTPNRWLSGFLWIRRPTRRQRKSKRFEDAIGRWRIGAASPQRLHARQFSAGYTCRLRTCCPSAPIRPAGHHRSIPPSPRPSERLP